MKKVKVPKIIKDPENEIPVELFEQAILDIASGFKALSNSRMTKRAIVLLVQNAVGVSLITKQQVESVLDAAQNLARIYLK